MAQLGSSKVYGDLYITGKTTLSPESVSDGLLYSVNPNIAATGTTQATATLVSKDINIVTSSTTRSAEGVILPVATIGRTINIFNKSANTITVYPATGGYIDTAAINVGKNVVAGGSISVCAFNTTNWESDLDMVEGVTGNIQTQLDGKLNLTGGTLTGDLTIGKTTPILSLGTGSSTGCVLKFRSAGGEGWLYWDDTVDTYLFKTNSGAFMPIKALTIESSVASGTAPFIVASTTKVTNLNADLLDGYESSATATNSTVVVRDSTGGVAATKYTVQSWSMLQDATSGSLKFMFG